MRKKKKLGGKGITGEVKSLALLAKERKKKTNDSTNDGCTGML